MRMRARFIHLSPKKAQEFSALKREAERDGAHRVARRLHAVLLNHQQHTSGETGKTSAYDQGFHIGLPLDRVKNRIIGRLLR